MDEGTEADAMADWEDDIDEDEEDERTFFHPQSHESGGDRPQPKRWRCLSTGCNPVLNEATAAAHNKKTGHRVAKWPVRSAAGKRKAQQRNQNGYYDRYNVGAKSARARGIR